MIKDTKTPTKRVVELVDTLINFEHGLVDLDLKRKSKSTPIPSKTQIGLKHE